MILYFSGTGNCLDVAERIAAGTNDKALSILDEAEPCETLGICYPVYFGGLPLPVIEFLKSYDFSQVKYLYAVGTYGGGIGGADAQMCDILKKRGVKLNASFGLTQPDNYLPLFNPPTEEEAAKTLEKGYAEIPKICEKINNRENTAILAKRLGKFYCNFSHKHYIDGRKTEKFYATDKCIKCGLCEKICPAEAIKISDVVQWTKEQCYFCMGCINRCPTKAIQYGQATEKRRRYVNPRLK